MALGRPRMRLHNILKDITPNVYFQPPANIALEYPCIVYHRYFADTKFANNLPYAHAKRYMITVIDRDPDGNISDQIAELPMCIFNRFFTSDDLNHDVYYIFY